MKTYTIWRGVAGDVLLSQIQPGAEPQQISAERAQRVVRTDSFNYGYHGTGPRILAAAILLDALHGAPDPYLIAIENASAFALAFLGADKRDKNSFTISQREVVRWFSNRISAGVRA